MKKVLVAFDGIHYSDAAMQFVNRLNQLDHLTVTGVFLPLLDVVAGWQFDPFAPIAPYTVMLPTQEEAVIVHEHIDNFKTYCGKNNIKYLVHHHQDDEAIMQLEKETRYADLLVLSSETFFKSPDETDPNFYLKEVLNHARCPVLLVPENAKFPKTNIIAYDGSDSSLFAIKQFSYLFPEFTDNKSMVIYASKKHPDYMPHMKELKELLSRHFSSLSYMVLDMDPRKQLADWMAEQPGSILVAGAFGKSTIFHTSFATKVIRDHQLPVFIAHH